LRASFQISLLKVDSSQKDNYFFTASFQKVNLDKKERADMIF
jgi:hypothetical protein